MVQVLWLQFLSLLSQVSPENLIHWVMFSWLSSIHPDPVNLSSSLLCSLSSKGRNPMKNSNLDSAQWLTISELTPIGCWNRCL